VCVFFVSLYFVSFFQYWCVNEVFLGDLEGFDRVSGDDDKKVDDDKEKKNQRKDKQTNGWIGISFPLC